MTLLAALSIAAAISGPTGLPALHSATAEQTQEEAILDRVRSHEAAEVRVLRKHVDPESPEARRAAAWRADHLTCTSQRGRDREQYQRECGAWLAEQAAAEAR
jgi:hypothetical protein